MCTCTTILMIANDMIPDSKYARVCVCVCGREFAFASGLFAVQTHSPPSARQNAL